MHQLKRRFPRKLLIVGGILAAVLVVAAVALPYLVDVNQYRGLIQSKAEEAIGRKVTLGRMTLKVFPSIGIRVESPEVEGLVKADSLVVGVRLLPLLMSDTIDVRKVVLERPTVTIARDSSDRWNFQDITDGAGGATSSGEEPAPEASRSFRLSSLVVRDASIRLLDERSGSSLEVGLTANGSMELTAAGDLEAAFDGDLESDGITIVVRGSVSRSASETARFDVLIDRSELHIAKLRDLARRWDVAWPVPDGLLRSETLTLRGRAAGTLEGETLADLALSDIVLEDADVRLERDRSGRWNFEAAGAGGGGQGSEVPASSGGPTIQARNVRIAGARVALLDEATAGAAELVLEDLNVLVEELAMDRPVRLEVESRIAPGGTLKLGGTLPVTLPAEGSEVAVDARCEMAGVQVQTVSAYLKALLGSEVTSGTVSGKAIVKGTYPGRLETTVSIVLEEITSPAAPRPVTASGEMEATLLDAAARAQIARFEADVAGSHVELRGSVDNSRAGTTIVDIEVLPTAIDSDDLHDLLVISGTELPFEFSAEKPIRLQAHVKGDVRSETPPDLTGSVEVAEATFHHPSMSKPMEKLAGKVTLEKDGFELTGFSAVIGTSDMAGRLSVKDFAAPRVGFDIESRHADFWELMSFVKEDESAAGSTQSAPASSTGKDDILGKVRARGTLKIAEGSFGTLTFTDLESTLSMERKVVTLDPVSMNLYSGSMSGSASMDMASDPPVVGVTARASRIDTDALLVSNLEMKDTLAGALSGELSVSASGSDERTIIKNARGSGEIRLEDGRVGAVNVLGILSKATDLMGERSLHEISGKLAEEGTEFSSMVASMKLAGGEVKAKSLSLVSPDLDLVGQGNLDLLNGTIDVKGQIVFSKGLSQAMVDEGSRAVDVFWDSDAGRVNLPLTLAGPVDAPLPNIDWGEAGNKLVKRKVQESVQKKLAEAGLSQLLGDQKSTLPIKSESARKTESKPAAASPPSEGELTVSVEAARFSGNILIPDLEIKGFLRGTAITSAEVKITDEDGNLLHEGSLMRRVKKFYTENDRGVPQAIAFGYNVNGKELALRKGDVTLAISVGTEGGETVTETVTIKR